jgi:hypothetical protein
MSRTLLILGVILALVGTAMVAYGIPINGFDWGNTLIIAGTTALTGGLLLFALAEVVRQLGRIADGIGVRGGERLSVGHDLGDAEHNRGATRIPFPPKPEPRRRAPVQDLPAEPRPEVAPSLAAGDAAAERAMPAFMRPARAPEPRIAPTAEEPRSAQPAAELRAPARADTDDDLAEGLLATAFSRLDVSLRKAPEAAQASDQEVRFDPLWPPAEREPEPESEPELAAAPEPDEAQEREPPYAVAILKSGVIDGMAYTLYSDGSIEAELAGGTMRFASVEELRAYLDQSSA